VEEAEEVDETLRETMRRLRARKYGGNVRWGKGRQFDVVGSTAETWVAVLVFVVVVVVVVCVGGSPRRRFRRLGGPRRRRRRGLWCRPHGDE